MDFKRQIEEDIALIQRDYGHIDDKLANEDYAFNYWVLSRLYSMDEDLIPSNVTDYNDKNIDCFVHYEDTKELFIIQNKFYDKDTAVNREHVSDFLKAPLNVLLRGEYSRSDELQRIFNRAYSDGDYKIWLHFYVTNNTTNHDIEGLFEDFPGAPNTVEAYVGAKYFSLDDIQKIYYGDRFTNKVSFEAILPTRVTGTSLDVRPEEYGLSWMIPLRYVLVNVAELYQIYKKAVERNYELFEENVREYLGTQGINNGIIKTLKSETDRENFFYYNNGITIICEGCKTLHANDIPSDIRAYHNYQYGFKLKNPQVVNGCQTINSIAEVLSHYNAEKLYSEFAKTFVLVKVFEFNSQVKKSKASLDKNIVRFTNSQNGINDKAFASKRNYFQNIQSEFRTRGYLLLVKPSDKNKFTNEFTEKRKFADLRKKNDDLTKLFDSENLKIGQLMIPLEKLLKVLLAFHSDGYHAFQKGSTVLKPNSPMYKDFSLNLESILTIDNMLRLYLLYNRAENDKKAGDKRNPISYYVVSFIGYSFKQKTYNEVNDKLNYLFADKNRLDTVYDFYKNITEHYSDQYRKKFNADYNVMIKQEISASLLEECIDTALRFDANRDVIKEFIDS